MAASSKKAANFSASSVALETISLMSSRYREMSFSRPKSTSVWSVRSWASSTMMALYEAKSGSVSSSRSIMPSVMYLMMVFSEVHSSKRML
eukprot:scaffold2448_cov250-Pinguiococcus_pyrenoidosus.AAC.16